MKLSRVGGTLNTGIFFIWPRVYTSFIRSSFLVCRFSFFGLKKKQFFFQEIHQNVKQFGPRSSPTFCRAWSGFKLFATTKMASTGEKSLTIMLPITNFSTKNNFHQVADKHSQTLRNENQINQSSDLIFRSQL